MQSVDIILGGLCITAFVGSYVATFLGATGLSYWLCMGDDPWEGRFQHAGFCYGVLSFILIGIGVTFLTALWSLMGAFQ